MERYIVIVGGFYLAGKPKAKDCRLSTHQREALRFASVKEAIKEVQLRRNKCAANKMAFIHDEARIICLVGG